MSLLFNTLSRFIKAFLRRSKCLFISWLQSPSIAALNSLKLLAWVGASRSGHSSYQGLAFWLQLIWDFLSQDMSSILCPPPHPIPYPSLSADLCDLVRDCVGSKLSDLTTGRGVMQAQGRAKVAVSSGLSFVLFLFIIFIFFFFVMTKKKKKKNLLLLSCFIWMVA